MPLSFATGAFIFSIYGLAVAQAQEAAQAEVAEAREEASRQLVEAQDEAAQALLAARQEAAPVHVPEQDRIA